MAEDELDVQLAEMFKLGCVSSANWESYTWKNELAEQKSRLGQLLAETLAEDETEHNPNHMLERAIGVAAVCMRRLIECHLVTDRFRDSRLAVYEIHAMAGVERREPFISKMASEIFNNYDMKTRYPEQRTPKVISDKMLHARVIGVLSQSAYLPDGLLIASDTQRKTQLFHFTSEEIAGLFDAFLEDEVAYSADGYLDSEGKCDGTRKVFAIRA